ncbi:hypothetical protein [Streptomyces sp. NPDC059176]|uniref:hypothetical protein n=1 Tax=Streptomyces sp. NPDC059176 TaxID=3346758 RepID=UPI0036C1A3FF
MTDVVAGHPAFKVGLTAGREGQPLAVEPVEEMDGCPQMLADDGELGVRDVVAAAASAKPSQEVPSRVPVQDFPSLGGGVGGDEIVHVPFQTDHLLVPLGQRAGGHEHAADVLDDFARREFVQGVVRQGPTAGAEIEQDGGDDAAGQPAHRRAGPFRLGQGVVEGLQLRGNGARGVSEKLVEPLPENAARARAGGSQSLRFPAGGTRAPELGVLQGPPRHAGLRVSAVIRIPTRATCPLPCLR